ncbi:MAG: T9SS type A sorting domain-containing protein, partial [Paludibacteraceae bacterium]|nr:T9SS type A sorting domain-containing protein [Paludibacteraceae bacterium]
SDAEAQIAKFADGHANAVVLEQGVLNGIKLNDPIAHVTTAAFSSADVAENLTITLFYELTGDAALLNNYNLDPTSDNFTTEGVIIEPFIPDNEEKPEDEEAKVNEGIEIYAYGYCDGSGYSLKYHLESGNPDQYKIDFADSRFTDVDWTNLVITGKDGTIDIEIPVNLPTGDYTMTVYFRDSRFDWLESRQFNVTFHVNLPETYVRPLFDNVIALVDTCHCLTDIQWYWRANSTELWQPIEGANGYYYHVDGKLTGEYFVYAKMNGEPTYTCGQTDMETLYGETQKASAPVVKAYPNPVVTTTTVTIENSTEWIHNIRIVNLMGVEVMSDTFEGNETNVEMSGYPQGNYMISVDGIVVKVMKK